MPVGQVAIAFGEAAAADGLELEPQLIDWINQRGHIGLEEIAFDIGDGEILERVAAVAEILGNVWNRLGGNPEILPTCRIGQPLIGDWMHTPSGTLIEIDEGPHFTSHRLTSLELYPEWAPLGFHMEEYKQACRDLAEEFDRYRRDVATRGWGIGGGAQERAYHDALRDLAAPAMGRPPVIRIPVLDDDGAGAYERYRDFLSQILKADAKA
jgi:hypothetical protein